MTYTMIQTMYPADTPWTEHFFDGEVRVVNNIVTFDRAHWRDALYQRGFVDYTPEVVEDASVDEAPIEAEATEEAKAEPAAPQKRKPGRPKKTD